MSEFIAVMAAINTVCDQLNVLASLHGSRISHEQIAELQQLLQSAERNAMFAVAAQTERIRQLENRLQQLEAWEFEKSGYDLAELSVGVFVYKSNSEIKGLGPEHYICAECYRDRRKSILQLVSITKSGARLYACHACKTHIEIRA